MRAWAKAAAILVVLQLMAGCAAPGASPPVTGGASAGPSSVSAAVAHVGTYYLFTHAGGDIEVAAPSGASARLEIYGPNDTLVGRFDVGSAGPIQLQAADPGDYVVRFLARNGTVALESAGVAVALEELATQVERRLLDEEPLGPVPALPLVPSSRQETPVDLWLSPPPEALRLLARGSHSYLHVVLQSAGNTVFEALSSGDFSGVFPNPYVGGQGLTEIPGQFIPDAFSGLHLTGFIESEDLQGALVLESQAYSRALPPGLPRLVEHDHAPTFIYGRLASHPTQFSVSSRATEVDFWQEMPVVLGLSPGTAWVALYDPHDHKLASVAVPPGKNVAVPVSEAGDYVAVLLQGNATLGADAMPADFSLKPLGVSATDAPDAPPGQSDQYGQANFTIDAPGVVFDAGSIQMWSAAPLPTFYCEDAEWVALSQGNATIGSWSPDGQGTLDPVGLRIHDGPLVLKADGFGDRGCQRRGVEVLSYTRS